MVRQAGIPLLTLLDSVDQVVEALPAKISEFLDLFSAVNVKSQTSAGAIFHQGKLQSVNDAIAGSDLSQFDLGFAKLTLPGVSTGIPRLVLPTSRRHHADPRFALARSRHRSGYDRTGARRARWPRRWRRAPPPATRRRTPRRARGPARIRPSSPPETVPTAG